MEQRLFKGRYVRDEAQDRERRSVTKREVTQGLIVRVYTTNSWAKHHQTDQKTQRRQNILSFCTRFTQSRMDNLL
jgi:hypothetical protein